jgi:hypothetical protein
MRYTLILICLPLLILSCTEEIDLDLDQKDRPSVVVEGFLTDSTEAPQWLRLTYTTGYYEKGKVPPVDGANVTVRGGGDRFTFRQNGHPDSVSYYMAPSSFDLKMGEAYQLEVEHQDSTYRSSSRMRPVPSIDSIHLRLDPFASAGGGEVEDTILQVVAHFRDLPSEGDHYLFNLYINGELKSKEANDKNVVADDGFDGEVELAVQSFQKSEIEVGDRITLTMRSVSEECDEFYAIFNDQTELSGNPFTAAPPANIPTNISGSALGFFQVSSVSSRTRPVDLRLLSEIEIPGQDG